MAAIEKRPSSEVIVLATVALSFSVLISTLAYGRGVVSLLSFTVPDTVAFFICACTEFARNKHSIAVTMVEEKKVLVKITALFF
ncbi:hypothetical protein D9M69_645710 [compost metagenome]